MTLEEMEIELRRVSDSNAMLDAVIKAAKLGEPKVMAFRCSHSGKYFPATYAKEWGKTTGIGLGEEVKSETLDSLYHVAPPPIESIKDPMDFLHPFQATLAQVDLVVVPQSDFEANALVQHKDDLRYERRKAILRTNQMSKRGSRIAAYMAEWMRINKEGGAA